MCGFIVLSYIKQGVGREIGVWLIYYLRLILVFYYLWRLNMGLWLASECIFLGSIFISRGHICPYTYKSGVYD